VIHLIDSVLALPVSPITTAKTAGLTALLKALDKAGLAKEVEAMKDVTIFVPLNAAFDKASAALTSISVEEVAKVLKYHVVPSVAFSTGLKDGQTLKTVQDGNLEIKISIGNVFINNAKVVVADILTKNGVVHVVDSVISMPGA
jgi:uncharacterized surface protein with fasciclin (FAS1) repeats